GTQATLRVGLVINGLAALALALLAARGVAEGSSEDRRLRVRVLSAAVLGTLAVVTAAAWPGWSTRLFDLGPTIYVRQHMDETGRRQYLEHRVVAQLSYLDGPDC